MRACAATPAPAEKLEKNGKEGEKEEDKDEGEAPSEKEKGKEKEKDEGKEVDSSKTGDPEEVGHCPQNTRYSPAKNISTLWFHKATYNIFLSSQLLLIYLSFFASIPAQHGSVFIRL